MTMTQLEFDLDLTIPFETEPHINNSNTPIKNLFDGEDEKLTQSKNLRTPAQVEMWDDSVFQRN